jgi:hypothetical protein
MNDSAHPTYTPHPNSTPGHQARDARARAWAYVFKVWNSKQAAERTPTPEGGNNYKMPISQQRRVT